MIPILDKVEYTFIQEGNCNASTVSAIEDEKITITQESSCESLDKTKGFYVIRTTTGWSIDSLDEIKDLFEQIKNIKHE